jgi:hypothetical protein
MRNIIDKGRFLKFFFMVSLFGLMAGCVTAKGMLRVKQTLKAKPSIFVKGITEKNTIGLAVPKRSMMYPHSRGPKNCLFPCVIERSPMPPGYDEVTETVVAELRKGLGKPKINAGKEDALPKRNAAFGMEVTDWSKTDYEVIINPNISVIYDETQKGTREIQYLYTLYGRASLVMWSINKEGDLEMLMPNPSGSYPIASVQKKLGIAAKEPKTLAELMDILPPTSILEEMKEKSKEGIENFIREMKAAKVK